MGGDVETREHRRDVRVCVDVGGRILRASLNGLGEEIRVAIWTVDLEGVGTDALELVLQSQRSPITADIDFEPDFRLMLRPATPRAVTSLC